MEFEHEKESSSLKPTHYVELNVAPYTEEQQEKVRTERVDVSRPAQVIRIVLNKRPHLLQMQLAKTLQLYYCACTATI